LVFRAIMVGWQTTHRRYWFSHNNFTVRNCSKYLIRGLKSGKRNWLWNTWTRTNLLHTEDPVKRLNWKMIRH
jgi:hypothetical protein